MSGTLVYKILSDHLTDGELTSSGEIGIRIDQTLTQDATGTTAFLLLEAMEITRVRTELSVSYVDHNLAQFGAENHNDHLYLQSIARKVGARHSRPGNGICHQVHFERFARPGATLLGSDSHTPTAGGMGMIAIGSGGLDVAVAMGGGAFYTTSPRVIGVRLKGELAPWVAAKDIILRLLSVLTTRGNVGCMVEYFGDGVASLPAPDRATCCNMGAELGVTASIFPSDERTREFLIAQGREKDFAPLSAEKSARYDRIAKRLNAQDDAGVIENIRRYCTDVEVTPPGADGLVDVSFGGVVIDLCDLEPLAACSPSPENVHSIAELTGRDVRQVLIGSCTNSSYQDLMLVAAALKGRTVHPNIELGIAPGSRQVLTMIGENGALADLIRAGARIVESGCGPCIGQGFSPADCALSLRTFNRNFAGRSGTKNDRVYLVSPASAVAAAITGEVTDPRELTERFDLPFPRIEMPGKFLIDDGMIQPPATEDEAVKIEVIRGETIVKPPSGRPIPHDLTGEVLLKVGDRITTDHITPAGALLKYRSNVPRYAEYVFNCFNEENKPTFAERALAVKKRGIAGVIVAGESYGQGSSREHAALCPMYLGIRTVIAKTIERIHQANLVNFAILPLTFSDGGAPAGGRRTDYDRIEQGDELKIDDVPGAIASADSITVRDITKGFEFTCKLLLGPRQRKILAAGGLLNYTRESK